MKEIVSVSLGSSRSDYEFTVKFLGQDFRVRRFGADSDFDKATALLREWETKAEAIGLGMVRDHYTVGTRRFEDPNTARLQAAVTRVPVTTGATIRGLLHEWAVRHVQLELGNYFTNARVLFLSGFMNYRLAQVLGEYTPNLVFADPVMELGIPKLLNSLGALELYAAGTSSVRNWDPPKELADAVQRNDWNRYVLRKAMQKATVVVAPYSQLESMTLEELGGKIIVTSAISEDRLKFLKDNGVEAIIDGTPHVLDRVVGLNIIDAMIIAHLGKPPEEILYDDYFEIIENLKVVPRIMYPSGKSRRINRFAFVIHPLSQEYFKSIKPVEVLSQVTPPTLTPVFMNALERVLAYAPPFVYTTVTGIKSPAGVEAEGWLISVGGTPKELLAHSPEFTYRRLLAAARMAKRLGAQIMGLGAFTKVVGDAGITVAKRAELPITTGNSYSASGALWAAHDAIARMGLVPLEHGKRAKAKGMVIGATGSIGSVCARLLAMVVEEIHLISPETAKLLTLRESILLDSPDAIVHIATRAHEYLADMDIIVTASAAAGPTLVS